MKSAESGFVANKYDAFVYIQTLMTTLSTISVHQRYQVSEIIPGCKRSRRGTMESEVTGCGGKSSLLVFGYKFNDVFLTLQNSFELELEGVFIFIF